jgi:hypothetical protein
MCNGRNTDHLPGNFVRRRLNTVLSDDKVKLTVLRYEHNMAESMYSASPSLQQPVSEIEVFSGQIIGSNGFQSKKSREYMMGMREEFDRHVAHTVDSMRMDDDGNTSEALPTAIACLAIGVEEEGYHLRKVGYLKSWKYVAAAVCLEELEKFIPGGFLAKMG